MKRFSNDDTNELCRLESVQKIVAKKGVSLQEEDLVNRALMDGLRRAARSLRARAQQQPLSYLLSEAPRFGVEIAYAMVPCDDEITVAVVVLRG